MADGQIGESTDLFKLFVGQIPKEMDEISLRQYFEEFGPIVEVSIIRDNITMLSKGELMQVDVEASSICLWTWTSFFRLRFCDVLIRALGSDGNGQTARQGSVT